MTQQLDYPSPGTHDTEGGAMETFQRNPRLAIGLGVAAIVLGTVLAYMPAIRGEFIWDDDYYVYRNPMLRSLSGLQRIWFDIFPSPKNYPLVQYYPMTFTSFWIEYKLWGLNPLGYHIVNVALHAANALLVWLILRKLAVPGAWLAAAIFALHPINVESVAWIAERKNVLSGFFFFSSLYAYLRFAGIIAPPAKHDEYFSLPADSARVWGLAFVLFFFGLASKTVICALPAVVLLIIWWKRGWIELYAKDSTQPSGFRSDVAPLLPFFALGIAAATLTGWMEVHHVGASGPEWDLSPLERILVAGRAAWFYTLKLIVPYPLMFNYPRWEISVASVVQWLYPIAAVAVIGVLVLARNRIGRGPVTAVLYFAGTLVPALGFFNVFPHRYSFVADHFVYLSSNGLIALVIALLVKACDEYLPREAVTSGAPAGVAAAVLSVFLILTLIHANHFKDLKSLWEDTWKKNNHSWLAANNYGEWIRDRARRPEAERLAMAEQWFEKVIQLKPDHPQARFNLAVIADRRQDPALAEQYYREAIRLFPRYGQAHYQLGQLYVSQKRIDEAKRQFEAAIAIDPMRANLARNALGFLLMQDARKLAEAGNEDEARRKYVDAIDQFIAALDFDPDFVEARNQLGLALKEVGRIPEAIAEWAGALEQDPNHWGVLNNLGQLMIGLERFQEAGVLFERAVQVNPNSALARTNLGTVAAMVGRTDVARQQFELALQIDPDYQPARQKLADLESGKLKAATTQAATAPTTGGAQ